MRAFLWGLKLHVVVICVDLPFYTLEQLKSKTPKRILLQTVKAQMICIMLHLSWTALFVKIKSGKEIHIIVEKLKWVILGQVGCLIVLIPDLRSHSYFSHYFQK